MSEMAGIRMEGVTKRFGPVEALAGVDLEVSAGQVVALLGANGAGKSTLVRIVATTVIPDSGTVEVAGCDAVAHPADARARTGVVLNEERSFYWRLSGRDNLEFFAAFHGLGRRAARARATEALEAVDLVAVAERRVDRYSSGMRARLGLARGLLGRPSVLVLDEPTRSLDPTASIAMRRLVCELASARHAAVLFVTHDLHEAAEVASAVVIMVRGRIGARVEGQTDAATLEQLFVAATG
jgi:ABC-2 type transport system ATP-binding protein